MQYHTLITPAQLESHIDDSNWRVIDCRFNLAHPEAGYTGYLEGHIPGALYADLEHDLSSPVRPGSGRHPLPERESLVQRFSSWGIDGNTQVIVYDTSHGMMAARLWWLLRWLGHEAVALLDGGLPRWQREGHPLSTVIPEHRTRQFVAASPLETIITSKQLSSQLDTRDHLLIDVRAPERFRGEVEPIDRIAGHIPGALNLPLQQNLDVEGNFLPSGQLKTLFDLALGTRTPNNVSVMCGSGVTACHTLLAMNIAGIEGVHLYAGSWSEWITDPDRPIVKGTA